MSIFTPKNSDDLFLVIDRIFSVFTVGNLIYIYIIYIYGPFLTRKTSVSEKKFLDDTCFTHFVLSHASASTASRIIGGRIHGPQYVERLVPTTPSFQTGTHDPPFFKSD